jgi:hypothetical protein
MRRPPISGVLAAHERHMCRYVRADPVVCAAFWRDVLYCDGERRSSRMARTNTRERRSVVSNIHPGHRSPLEGVR